MESTRQTDETDTENRGIRRAQNAARGTNQSEEKKKNNNNNNNNNSTNATSTMKMKFQQLSSEKQFGLMALVSLGTAMLVTGRTVRVVMKRMARTDSVHQPIPVRPDLNELKMRPTDIPKDARIYQTRAMRGKFWDNRSLRCVQGRDEEERSHGSGQGQEDEAAMNFNPAMDGIKALGLATMLVIGASCVTVATLSTRWELDGWDDWRIFIQAGLLGKHLLPPDHWSRSLHEAIPDRLRPSLSPSPSPSSEQQDLLTPPHLSNSAATTTATQWIHSWKESLDEEWHVEKERRDAERLEWENRRKELGKKTW
ncbi:hypothetical protein PCANC_07908 [Puccinia coronata f. sp. avenae]|uniref:Uncharacterized protein n=1 Tax=Puccinia coronata f. sp. avenae TaxID=200324 RepID=A0A2N5UQF1_9BASI|nr:hypothetical protein PCASD_22387 [Puccinia coronata f. sp. avenae]PLW39989.1 hypothetical protein PCASD_06808 [Puccinia coronata f. sp. avenae]PLW42699.1 hypothetical protein PCANC_07908 [Puccinia coronata f. sp. avenae]